MNSVRFSGGGIIIASSRQQLNAEVAKRSAAKSESVFLRSKVIPCSCGKLNFKGFQYYTDKDYEGGQNPPRDTFAVVFIDEEMAEAFLQEKDPVSQQSWSARMLNFVRQKWQHALPIDETSAYYRTSDNKANGEKIILVDLTKTDQSQTSA